MTTSFSDKDHLMIHMLVQSVVRWHEARNLIDGATDKDQVLKLIQEVGELSDNVCKGQDIRDPYHLTFLPFYLLFPYH